MLIIEKSNTKLKAHISYKLVGWVWSGLLQDPYTSAVTTHATRIHNQFGDLDGVTSNRGHVQLFFGLILQKKPQHLWIPVHSQFTVNLIDMTYIFHEKGTYSRFTLWPFNVPLGRQSVDRANNKLGETSSILSSWNSAFEMLRSHQGYTLTHNIILLTCLIHLCKDFTFKPSETDINSMPMFFFYSKAVCMCHSDYSFFNLKHCVIHSI